MSEGVRLREIDGRRSSQAAGKAVFAAAALAADPSLAQRIAAEKDWRKHYIGPLRSLVEAGARSARAAVNIARAGIEELQDRVEFERGGEGISLAEAIRSSDSRLKTETIQGSASAAGHELAIPYRGELLRGDSIRQQLDTWVERGIVEASCREAVEKVVANPDWLDLSDRRFVLLGAASEMGALPALCAWGADVIAIDLPDRRVHDRIGVLARQGAARVSMPALSGRDIAGADLLSETPEIAQWLGGFDPPYTIVDDTYADGAQFMLLASATDALIGHLAARPGVSLAYLATPTDVFAVPEEIALETRTKRRGFRPMRALSAGALYKPSYEELVNGEDGRRWGIVDSLVAQQGANYALAKTLQRWRAVSARADGTLVSANVAPATRTRSVTKNKALAAAYRGASAYGLEIFEPDTSRWLMAALMVHDLRNGSEGSAPEGHPFDLYTQGAAHGGMWRLPYEPRSILPLAVLRGLIRRR